MMYDVSNFMYIFGRIPQKVVSLSEFSLYNLHGAKISVQIT